MNKIKLLSLVFFFCYSFSLLGQELDWLKNSTSNDVYTSHSFYTSTQHNNDFYFAGDFWKDLTIDGINITIGDDDGNGFIIKMDEAGLASGLWHFESDDYVRINAIGGNPVSGNLIVTGNFSNNLIYNNEVWDAPVSTMGFVLSIQPDGTLDWMKEIEPQSNVSFASGQGVAIDEEGNVFVGFEASGMVNIDNQSFLFEPETGGCIISKFNANGDLLSTDVWRNENFEGWIDIVDVAIDVNNQLIVVGSTFGTVEIGDSTFVFSEASHQPLIVKHDNDLNLQWLKTYEGTSCHVRDIHMNETELILSLQYRNSIDLDGEVLIGSGSWGDIAILSLKENAELNWAKNFTLSENGGIHGVYANDIVNWNGQYYIGGMYQGDVVHEGALILDNSQSGATYQYPFILSLTHEGELASVYDFVGSNEPGRISGMSANASHLLFGGDFSGQITIGDTSVNTINSALFYGALAVELTELTNIEDNKNLFEIYPTLSSDFLNIKTTEEIKTISLISSVGTLLKQFSGDTRVIDVNDLTAGFYYLSADIDGEIVFAKFVRE